MIGLSIIGSIVAGGLLLFMLILTLKNFHPQIPPDFLSVPPPPKENKSKSYYCKIAREFVKKLRENKNNEKDIFREYEKEYINDEKVLDILGRIRYFLKYSETITDETLLMLVKMNGENHDFQ